MFSTLLDRLKLSDLLLADRYYCTYAIIALLIQTGVDVLFQNHARRKTGLHRIHKSAAKDYLVEWKKPPRKPVWLSEERYRTLPETLLIRELAVNGIVYVTTLTNVKKYPRKALAELYATRWTVEISRY